MSDGLRRLQRVAIVNDLWDRIIALERRLQDLEAFSTMPTIDTETGGDTYVNVLQEVEILEGDGMAVTGAAPSYTVGLGMELPLVWDGTNPPTEYTTLAAAIAAASSEDTIWLPPGEYSGDVTVPAGVTLLGMSREDVVLTGEITLSAGSRLDTLTVDRDEDSAGPIYGIVEGAGEIMAILHKVTVNVANATGEAYAVYMENGGTITAKNCDLLAETGSSGYAGYLSDGILYHHGGRAVGTTAYLPYYT